MKTNVLLELVENATQTSQEINKIREEEERIELEMAVFHIKEVLRLMWGKINMWL